MSYPSKLMRTKQLEHLGIVAGIVDQLNLEEQINECLEAECLTEVPETYESP